MIVRGLGQTRRAGLSQYGAIPPFVPTVSNLVHGAFFTYIATRSVLPLWARIFAGIGAAGALLNVGMLAAGKE